MAGCVDRRCSDLDSMNGIIQMTTLLLLALLMGCGTSDAPPSEPTAFDTTTVEQTRTLPYEMDATSRRLFNEAMAYAREHDLARRPIGEVMQVMGRSEERRVGKGCRGRG